MSQRVISENSYIDGETILGDGTIGNPVRVNAAAVLPSIVDDGSTVSVNADLQVNGQVGFYNTAPGEQPEIVGSRGGNAALASLLTELDRIGLIIDSTVP